MSAMISQRRPIHKDHFGEDEKKQVQRKCSNCHKPSIEDNTDHEQLESEPEISQGRGKKLGKLQPIQIADFLCKDCVITNQEIGLKVLDKVPAKGLIILVAVILILCCLGVFGWTKYNRIEKTFSVRVLNQTQDEIDFDDELYGLGDTYKQQEEKVWYTFAAGIKSVLAENPNMPSVFLLLYNNDEAEKTVKCLAKDVTRAATKYIMKREMKPLFISGKELNHEKILKDPGLLLVYFKEKVENTGAMIVTNLEDVKPKIAASFHFFCDRYSPLVEKAIYLFTLRVEQFPKTHLQKVAEDTLQSLWVNELPDHIMNPLITRMTGNVLRISNDYSGCYL